MKDKKKAAGAGAAIILLGVAAFAGAKAAPEEAVPAAEKKISILKPEEIKPEVKPEEKAFATEVEQARAAAEAAEAKLSAVEETIINAVITAPEFTASQDQIAIVKPILSDYGYEAAVDAACARAVEQAAQDTQQTGEEHYVALTVDSGYHSATWSELVAEYGPL